MIGRRLSAAQDCFLEEEVSPPQAKSSVHFPLHMTEEVPAKRYEDSVKRELHFGSPTNSPAFGPEITLGLPFSGFRPAHVQRARPLFSKVEHSVC